MEIVTRYSFIKEVILNILSFIFCPQFNLITYFFEETLLCVIKNET